MGDHRLGLVSEPLRTLLGRQVSRREKRLKVYRDKKGLLWDLQILESLVLLRHSVRVTEWRH